MMGKLMVIGKCVCVCRRVYDRNLNFPAIVDLYLSGRQF